MTRLFLINSVQDEGCAARLRADLTAQGYVVNAGAEQAGAAAAWQAALRESRAVVLVWSTAAAQEAGVAAQVQRAQWLHKRLVLLALDATNPLDSLAQVPAITAAPDCASVVAQLVAHLPPAGDAALLSDLLGQAPGDVEPATRGGPAHDESRHIIGVRCAQGHVTYYDKRVVCRADGMVPRAVVLRDGKQIDQLRLRCTTGGCDEITVVEVDCEGYR